MKQRSAGRFVFAFIISFSGLFLAFAPFASLRAEPKLSLESIRHYQISIEAGLAGLFRRDKELISLPKEGDFYIRSKYDPTAKEADLAFGSLHSPLEGSERQSLAAGEKGKRLRAVLELDSYLLFLDSSRRQLLVWSETRKEWHPSADLILDQIRPPADRGGEPPASEIKRAQKTLQKEYRAAMADPELLIGMTPLPKKWRDRDQSQFLLLLRLPRSPLLTVRCEGAHFSRCIAQRSCFVDGLTASELIDLRGVALNEAKNELWVGLPEKQKLLRLSLSSCLHVKVKERLSLDADMKRLSSLHFDAEGNLWVSLDEPSAKLSGSVFRWDRDEIERVIP